jgi:hypothetical protein
VDARIGQHQRFDPFRHAAHDFQRNARAHRMAQQHETIRRLGQRMVRHARQRGFATIEIIDAGCAGKMPIVAENIDRLHSRPGRMNIVMPGRGKAHRVAGTAETGPNR